MVYTVSSSSTSTLQVARNRNIKRRIIRRQRLLLLVCILIPMQQLLDDLIALHIHDTHVRGPGMPNHDLDIEMHRLSGLVCLNIRLVVGELHSTTEP
jgi:hypothetical protein